MAECARLESVYRETYRGFKSRILRHLPPSGNSPRAGTHLERPRCSPVELDLDADVLRLEELVYAGEAAFATEAALLESPKRCGWI